MHIHSCDHSDAHQAPQHPVCLICSVPHLQYKIHVLQTTNVAEDWQLGFGSIHFSSTIQIVGLASTKHG